MTTTIQPGVEVPCSGKVLSSYDALANDEGGYNITDANPIHASSHLDDVMTCQLSYGCGDRPVVSANQLSYGCGIETQSDVESTELESTNDAQSGSSQPNVFSISDPQGIQLEIDLSGWFNTGSQ
ncbi:hypothetical protein HAX54_016464 [Datura stramonium]|uniref:Uncharacterized protein n=1 Tax=Datura stramonium TaxID=4076 RepID=A0ABS8UIX0_DATST|nr:hypothetical protein [Datura stramonium]